MITRRSLFKFLGTAAAAAIVLAPEGGMAAVLGSQLGHSDTRFVTHHMGMPTGNSTIVVNEHALPMIVYDHRGAIRGTVAPGTLDSFPTLYDSPWEKRAYMVARRADGTIYTEGAVKSAHVVTADYYKDAVTPDNNNQLVQIQNGGPKVVWQFQKIEMVPDWIM